MATSCQSPQVNPGLQKFMRKSPYTKELSLKDAPVCIALCRAQDSFTS